jgi:hypothetical protein
MTTSEVPSAWPADKLTALRLGRRLVTEVTPAGPGRRAFVDIQPVATGADREAGRQGWTRSDDDRTFTLEHWDYAADQLDGFDHDQGAVLVRTATAAGEQQLRALLDVWDLHFAQFLHPWQTDDPK